MEEVDDIGDHLLRANLQYVLPLTYCLSSQTGLIVLTNAYIVNLNASLYANGQKGIARDFDVSMNASISGTAVFLVTYAFGCEL